MNAARISVVLPVYNEDQNIQACLRGLWDALRGFDHEILVCYDFDEDRTLPAIASMTDRPPTVKLVKNDVGPGVAGALRAGFRAASGDVVVTTMADLSDPPAAIPAMVEKIRRDGADVVSGSRYMKGGSQTGGPKLKRFLSRAAGLSLHWIAGIGTHDVTTNFRAYRASFLRRVEVESRGGFEVATELTVKAHLEGLKVGEVASSWTDRTAGESRFRLRAWLPRYLRWYGRAMAAPVLVLGTWGGLLILALAFVWRFAPALPVGDEWKMVPYAAAEKPVTMEWLWSPHNEHRIVLPKLIYLGLARLTRMDSREMAGFNVLLLGAGALVLAFAARSLRGRWVAADAFLPMLMLHWGHWNNLCFPFQLALVLPAFLLSVLIGVLVVYRDRPEDAGLPVGLLLCALPLCGAVGVPVATLLAPWLCWTGIRRRRWLPAFLSLVTGVLVVFYLAGYRQPAHHVPSPGVSESVIAGMKCLSMAFGSRVEWIWPASGLAILAILSGATLQFQRAKAGGALLAMGAFVGLAVLVGYGRAGQSYHHGFVERYTTLMAPMMGLAYLGYELGKSKVVLAALACAMLALLGPNADDALQWMHPIRTHGQAFLQGVRQGTTLSELSKGHAANWDLQGEDFDVLLGMLSRAKMSAFRD